MITQANDQQCVPNDFLGTAMSSTFRSWPEPPASILADAPNSYQLLGRDDLKKLPPLEWLIKGILPAKGVALIYGPSGSGKSFVTFDLALAVANGSTWFDYTVNQAPVVYIALEGQFGFKLRLEAWERHHGKNAPAEYKMVLQDFKLTDPLHLAKLIKVLPKGALIIIDTLNRTSPTSDENLSSDMGLILEAARKLQEATEGLVLIVHHSGKSAAAGPRGHSSLYANCDAIIEVTRQGDYRKWTLAKAKEDEDGLSRAFVLEKLVLGEDSDGDELSSCVIRSVDSDVGNSAKAKSPAGSNQRLALQCVREMLESKNDGVGRVKYAEAHQKVASVLDVAKERKSERAKDVLERLIANAFLVMENDLLSLPAKK